MVPSESTPLADAEDVRARALRLGVFAAAVIGLLVLVGLLPTLGHFLSTDPFSDVHAYYDAAARLNQGQPLYPAAADVNGPEFYRYPPLLAVAFRPLALLPFPVAAAIWEVATIVALVLALRLLGPPRRVLLAIAILAYPIAWCLAIGQAQVIVTWLLALRAPWSVALAGQLKLFPALAAVYWLGRRDWRSLARFVAWSAGLVLLQLLLEPRGTIDFIGIANLSQVGAVNNLSPYALSPVLWAILVALGAAAAFMVAPTRRGWPAAVALSVLATPRLLSYLLVALLAGLRREPDSPPA